MKNLFIDIGSTDIKYVCDGERDCQKIPFPMSCAKYPYFESEPEKIVHAVHEILQKNPSVKQVFFSVQMHGYILRLKSGKVLPYVSWRDRRAERETFEVFLPERSGTSRKVNIAPHSIAHRLFVGELKEEWLDEIFTLGSYLVYRFVGKNITHITDAAALAMYDVDAKAFPLYGLRLPRAEKKVICAGMFEDKKIFLPVGDMQAAIFSLPEENLKNSCILNLGTAAQMCAVGEKYIEYGKSLCESRPFFDDRFVYTITGLKGGEYIRRASDNGVSVKEVEEDYRRALSLLPFREKLVVIGGGVAQYHRVFLEEVLSQLNVDYSYAKASAIDGLYKLTERSYE